jgi:cytochrome d ubiquinol oxidase subunit II
VTIASLLVLVAFELYPTLLLASNDAANSITVYNAASSDTSLGIMLSFVCVGVPLIAGYTFFVYRAFWGKVELGENSY